MGFIINFLRRFFPTLFRRLGIFLSGFLGAVLGPFIQFIAGVFKKIGLLLMIVAAIGLAIELIALAFDTLFGEILSASAPTFVEIGRMFLPSNMSFCITVLVVARLKSLIFLWVTRLSEKLIHT
ncbi:hypothetical protein RAL92_21745 [Metapseudomonas otitidis]|uniref:hypothetical protein n=1 Tax=Metapseudomonas otitidis TaxID=319939 RepID=UPI003216CDD9